MLTPWKGSYDQPRHHIKKQRHYFANQGPSSQGYGFSSGCESWTIRKAERRRTDAFELWCWKRLLRVPWTARRSNQSILKEISPGISLERMTLKLKLQYFGHLMEELTHLKRPWCWERLRAGREGDDRGCDGWMASPTRWTWVWVDAGSWWWTGRPGVLRFMGSQRVGHYWVTKLNWTEADPLVILIMFVSPTGEQEPCLILLTSLSQRLAHGNIPSIRELLGRWCVDGLMNEAYFLSSKSS